QAEDGIRDDLVTGVQTCALPIFESVVLLTALVQHLEQFGTASFRRSDLNESVGGAGVNGQGLLALEQLHQGWDRVLRGRADVARSEERRVGKEGRVWWAGRRGEE